MNRHPESDPDAEGIGGCIKYNYLSYYRRGLTILDDSVCDDLWGELKHQSTDKGSFDIALRIWAGMQHDSLFSELGEAKEADLCTELERFHSRIIEIERLFDEMDPAASVRVLFALAEATGSSDKDFFDDGGIVEAEDSLARSFIGLKNATRAAHSHFRENVKTGSRDRKIIGKCREGAVGDLIALWVWATGGATFGDRFDIFACKATKPSFGRFKRASMERLRKKAVADYNKSKGTYRLEFLNGGFVSPEVEA